MFGLGPGGHATILFEPDGALVVLTQNIEFHNVSLCFQEKLYPHRVRQVNAGANKLCLPRALLGGLTHNPSAPKRYDTTCVALHVQVHGESGVHQGHHLIHVVGTESVVAVHAAMNVLKYPPQLLSVLLGAL